MNAQRVRTALIEAAERIFKECDVIACPSTGITAPTVNTAALSTEEINGLVTGQIMRFSLFGTFFYWSFVA